MIFKPVLTSEPALPLSPLVIDSPHSGRDYPDDFGYTCPWPLLRQTEDFLVDELIAGAAQAGATVIAANFPRCYIDVNRAENDIDPAVLAEPWDAPLSVSERTLLGLGLVRRLCVTGIPVYDAPLPVAAVKRRIESCYRPYHGAVTMAMERRVQQFGCSYLLNCHSMPSHGQSQAQDDAHRADFVLGDRNGTSCDPSFTRMAVDRLQEAGFSVALNEPYKGMEIVRRHGNPAAGRHALQIEINRRLYMDERKFEQHDGFVLLQRRLTEFFTALAADIMRTAPESLAAE